MAVYKLQNFADIIAATREELGLQASDTTAITRLKRDINMIYQEIIAEGRWTWLQGFCSTSLPAYYADGTCTVVAGQNTVALSLAPTTSKAGLYFAVDGYSEIYVIESHAAASTTLKLNTEYTGGNAAGVTFKIWTDKVVLPTDCQDVSMVWHDHQSQPMEKLGLRDLRRHQAMSVRAEGKPTRYAVGDYVAPTQTSAISSLPALTSRASDGVVKTLVFASALPTALVAKVNNSEAVRWRINGAGHYSYNGDVVLASVSTTSVTNDTLTYVGVADYDEAATADATLSARSLDAERANARYRELVCWPAINPARVTLHVDYIKDAAPLENDTDEPVLPLEDRIVLVYGTLSRSWVKVGRNPEEAARNERLYQTKLAKMQGRLQDTMDRPRLAPSRSYMASKRTMARGSGVGNSTGFPSLGGGSQGAVVSGPANTVAYFDGSGLIQGSAVSPTTLGLLGGLSGNVQTQFDAITTLADGKIYIGNGSNVATEVTPAGDVTISNAGATTIVAGAVDDANLDVTSNAYQASLDATRTTAALADNQAAAATVLSYAAASYPFAIIEFSLKRGTGKRKVGTLLVATDGTSVNMSEVASELGSCGVVFTADISGANVRLRYTSTSTGTAPTMKYVVRRWA